jgi:hypothetical protein
VIWNHSNTSVGPLYGFPLETIAVGAGWVDKRTRTKQNQLTNGECEVAEAESMPKLAPRTVSSTSQVSKDESNSNALIAGFIQDPAQFLENCKNSRRRWYINWLKYGVALEHVLLNQPESRSPRNPDPPEAPNNNGMRPPRSLLRLMESPRIRGNRTHRKPLSQLPGLVKAPEKRKS